MLNRRHLRVRVMQALYSYDIVHKSVYGLAIDKIEQKLKANLNPSNKLELEKARKEFKAVKEAFNFNMHNTSILKTDGILEDQSKEMLNEALLYYRNQIKEEKKHFKDFLNYQIDNLYELYIKLLVMVANLAQFERIEQERLQQKLLNTFVYDEDFKLKGNLICKGIEDSQILRAECERLKIKWTIFDDFIADFYRNVIKTDEKYISFVVQSSREFEYDRSLIIHLFQEKICKHDVAQAYLEEIDMNWDQDRKVVQNMVSCTIRSMKEENPADFELRLVEKNWEQDQEFYFDLFEKSLIESDRADKLIQLKAKNWDLDRLAVTDKVLIKMAIAEFIHFPSIPVKATLNEYIDLAKYFSTPQSRFFVNGLLHGIAEDLKSNGQVKKSGRGLLDNK